MFVKVLNNRPEVYSLSQLHLDYPAMSFPKDIPLDILVNLGIHKVKETSIPTIDYKTHRHIQSFSYLDSQWVQVWNIEELPIEQASANVRAHRDNILKSTDWIMLKAYELGENVPIDWLNYRQALRNITTQIGFPYKVIWPIEPK